MNTRLDLVINNFKEFIRNIRVSNIDDEVEIEYTPLLYDYIDDDLDFNEEYYKGLCNTFQRWLEAAGSDMVKAKEARKVRIIHNRMIFRNKDSHRETVTFERNHDESYIATTRETREYS